jgi:hypothetical protein
MNKYAIEFAIGILTVTQIICTPTSAADLMEERARKLSAALGVPLVSTIPKTPFRPFEVTNTIHAGEVVLALRGKDADKSTIEFDVLDKDRQLAATGHLIACGSFDAARTALIRQMVECTAPIEALIQKYILLTNSIGDLAIGERIYSTEKQAFIIDQSAIHFVRHGLAISVYTIDKSKDARQIAKAIDQAVLNFGKNDRTH